MVASGGLSAEKRGFSCTFAHSSTRSAVCILDITPPIALTIDCAACECANVRANVNTIHPCCYGCCHSCCEGLCVSACVPVYVGVAVCVCVSKVRVRYARTGAYDGASHLYVPCSPARMRRRRPRRTGWLPAYSFRPPFRPARQNAQLPPSPV